MPDSVPPTPTITELSARIAALERRRERSDGEAVSTGCAELDRLFPQGGLLPGSLIEWLSAVPGSGATALAATCAREICKRRGMCLAVDRRRTLYPPALWKVGISPSRLAVVRPASDANEEWALDQALRCREVGAVLAWPRRLSPVTFRRLQLAAEANGTVGMLLRPYSARKEPSFADVRFLVTPIAGGDGRRLKVEILYARNRWHGSATIVELDAICGALHETNSLLDTSPLAHQAALPRAAGI